MNKSQQQGGTLLGVIIGLVVGLAIAVVVALAITKGASPFVNKVGKADKPESASAVLSDPNKPLYSNKEAAKEAAKEFVQESTPPASAPAPAVVAKPAEAAKNEVAKAADAKPQDTKATEAKASEERLDKLIDKAIAGKTDGKAGDGKTEAKPDAAEEKWTYYLQAGAFRDHADAENARAKLALLGFEAGINERNSDNGVLYRVRIGPFSQVEAMNKVRAKLSENGIDVAVARNQK
jgi:cell division protein FtsN